MLVPHNIYSDSPKDILPNEIFTDLLKYQNIKIEKIISTGQVTPIHEIYDQPQAEWVILLQGEARLWLENTGGICLKSGDYLFIPAHQKHRVTYTSAKPPAVWLAVHIFSDN